MPSASEVKRVWTRPEPHEKVRAERKQGNRYVVEQKAAQVGVAVDVRSNAVSIVGNRVSVDLPADLLPDNTYSVSIDAGDFIDIACTPWWGWSSADKDSWFAADNRIFGSASAKVACLRASRGRL